MPVIASEVQLLWKCSDPRDVDEWDREQLAPVLSAEQVRWLDDALAVVEPGHRWRVTLR